MSAPTLVPERRGIFDRELHQFPKPSTRFACLGIVVLATIVLYYQFYLAGAVAAGTGGKNGILVDYHMSFVYYVNIAVIGYILGAGASFATGVADRYGRANIVTIGLFVVSLLCVFGIPLADSKLGFGIVFALIGAVEGVILVATPALIRDFSPQLGRASAMGFWTLGPVLGSLVVSIQISATSDTTPWHDQYIASGIVGLIVAVLSAFFLRELAPNLRDQLMVSARDRALVEARAAGIDVEASLRHPFRQMLKPDIILSAFSISVFLIIYYVAVGFFPAYFQTIFGFTQSKANSLGNYVWAFDAAALLIIGYLSDKIRVRKPFMVVGAVGAIVMTVIFATRATHLDTSYTYFAITLSLLAVFLGVAYAPWMASFTETVEKRNPALAATGLAVWGLVIRIVIAVSVFIVPHVVTTVSTLVEKGGAAAAGAVPGFSAAENQTVQAVVADPTVVDKFKAADIAALAQIAGISAKDVAVVAEAQASHGPALEAAQAIDPTTQKGLLENPTDATLGQKAVQEIVSKLGVSSSDALARLKDLAAIPSAELVTISTDGPKIVAAQAVLASASTASPSADLAKVSPATLAVLGQYAPLAEPKVQKILQDVAKAKDQSPKQWQHYFWIAVGGEIVFIPLIFLLAGFWSPKRARDKEREHEAFVEAELAKLGK